MKLQFNLSDSSILGFFRSYRADISVILTNRERSIINQHGLYRETVFTRPFTNPFTGNQFEYPVKIKELTRGIKIEFDTALDRDRYIQMAQHSFNKLKRVLHQCKSRRIQHRP